MCRTLCGGRRATQKQPDENEGRRSRDISMASEKAHKNRDYNMGSQVVLGKSVYRTNKNQLAAGKMGIVPVPCDPTLPMSVFLAHARLFFGKDHPGN
jgi:hypothetical protein